MAFACCCTSDRSVDQPYEHLGMPSPRSDQELLIATSKGGAVNLSLTPNGLAIVTRKDGPLGPNLKPSKSKHRVVPYLQVLAAAVTGTRITLAFLQVRSSSNSTLTNTTGTVTDSEVATKWCDQLLQRAYPDGTKRGRRFLVLVNPFGGPGKGKASWEAIVRPILAAANCVVDLQFTGPSGSEQHAYEVVKRCHIKDHDAIMCVSGDGIAHEVINGLASRADAAVALGSLPIVPVPAGSGNALSINLHGPKRSVDVAWATLAAVKGKVIPLDLCAMTQEGKSYYAFLSAAFGIMADLDLGTEHLRWMGDTRFVVGFIQGALSARKYPVDLLIKVVETNKETMAKQYNATLSDPRPDNVAPLAAMPELHFGTSTSILPAPEESVTEHADLPEHLEPGWHRLRTDVFLGYAGKLPWVSRDLRAFPVSNIPGDSVIDLLLLGPTPRIEALQIMDGAERGSMYWHKRVRSYKVSCLRYTSRDTRKEALVAIDGERVPGTPFQMESCAAVARVLALEGKWYGEEFKR